MAKAESAKKASGKTKGKGGARIILAMIVFGSLVPFGAPTLLVCLGLLPALVALCTDTDPRKSAFTTVGFMNLAGVVPFIIELWEKGQTMEAAFTILRQPLTWLVMFGAAALGQLLLYTVPPFMVHSAVTTMESRLRRLREGLEHLEAVWGTEVATSKPLNVIRGKE
jgi:hypothetical protein